MLILDITVFAMGLSQSGHKQHAEKLDSVYALREDAGDILSSDR